MIFGAKLWGAAVTHWDTDVRLRCAHMQECGLAGVSATPITERLTPCSEPSLNCLIPPAFYGGEDDFQTPVERELAAICLMMETGTLCFSASTSYSLIRGVAATSVQRVRDPRRNLWPTNGQRSDVTMWSAGQRCLTK